MHQINAVRKHLSRIKGGRLAQSTPAKITALLLSDVTGDDTSVIASGPTVPDPSTFANALDILDHYELGFPKVREHFQRGIAGKIPESPKADDPLFERVSNHVIGSNYLFLATAKDYWQSQGFKSIILSDRFEGDVKELARFHAALITSIRIHQQPFQTPIVLLSGGEATVQVKGKGMGGRNQEFALWLLNFLKADGVWALSAGSDGIDGNSPAAGAFLSPDTWLRAKHLKLDVTNFLAANDSYTFFKTLNDSLETGPTQHNLNDFRAILIDG
ncbi:MAG: MOFRL family protein [Deinococcales bacterium]